MTILAKDIQTVQGEIATIQQELESFQQPAALKAWLKNYKIPKEADYDELDELFFGGMGFGYEL
jgi:hypothetical protein